MISLFYICLLRACMPMLLQGQATANGNPLQILCLRPLGEGIVDLTTHSVSQGPAPPVRHQWWPRYLSPAWAPLRCRLTRRDAQPAQQVMWIYGETMGPPVRKTLSTHGTVSRTHTEDQALEHTEDHGWGCTRIFPHCSECTDKVYSRFSSDVLS